MRYGKWTGRLVWALAAAILLVLAATPAIAQDSLPSLFQKVDDLGKAGHKAEAAQAARRMLAALDEAQGLPHLARANIYARAGDALWAAGQTDEALAAFKKGLAELAQATDAQPRDVASRNQDLGFRLFDKRRYPEAEFYLRRAIKTLKSTTIGAAEDQLANATHTLASILRAEGRKDEALAAAREAVATWEKAGGPDSNGVATGSNTIAVILQEMDRLPDAAVAAERAFRIYERRHDYGGAANAANTVAGILKQTGRIGDAEVYAQKAVAYYGRDPNPDNEALVNALNSLVSVLLAQDRAVDALPLAQRVLESRRRTRGPDDGETGNALNTLVDIELRLGKLDSAETSAREVVRIWDKTAGPRSNAAGNARNTLAGVLQVSGKLPDALDVATQALQIWRALESSAGGATALGSWRVATIHMAMGQPDAATPLFETALRLWSAGRGNGDRLTALARSGLMAARFAQGDWAGVIAECDAQVQSAVERSGFGAATLGEALSSEFKNDIDHTRTDIDRCVKAAWRVAEADPGAAPDLAARTFVMAQRASSSLAATALAQMSARVAKGSGPLADLVRQREQLIGDWRRLNASLYQSLGGAGSDGGRRPAETIRKEMAEAQRRKDAIDAELESSFPNYASVSTPQPVALGELEGSGERGLLADGEALVFLATTAAEKPAGEETFAWIVTRGEAQWIRLDLGEPLASLVDALRCGLDETAWRGEGEARCQRLVDPDFSHADLNPHSSKRKLPPFDLERAHALYRALFGKAEREVRSPSGSWKKLIVVPSGPLAQLPLQVLVTEPPVHKFAESAADSAGVRWLALRQPVTVLPAVANLASLRKIARPSEASRPYIAFANPMLEGIVSGANSNTTEEYRAWSKAWQACASPGREQICRGDGPPTTSGRPIDPTELREWAPLPQTACEVCAIAGALGVDAARDVKLGAAATVQEVERLGAPGGANARSQLQDYRIIHFATHAMTADPARGFAEPGLVLTPPAGVQPTALDRNAGYLSASDIASLKLDADLVILSACNTAAGAASDGEALAGLGRAFFLAGARSALVSNWEVRTNAAVDLTTRMLGALAAEPSLGRPVALQRALAGMIGDAAGYPVFLHPSYWGAFSLVGDGR